MRASHTTVAAHIIAFVTVTGGIVGFAVVGGPSAETASPVGTVDAYHDESSWSNVSLHPEEAGDAYPGNDEATWTLFLGVNRDHYGDWMIMTTEAMDSSQCDTPDVKAEGIIREGQRLYDRPPEGDDTTTAADKSIISSRKQSTLTEEGIFVDWYEEDDIGGDPPDLDRTDEVIATFEDCFVNAEDPGWYQAYFKFNGTTPDGEYITEEYYSHYLYICECDSYEEAEETLGPAPSREGTSPSSPTPTEMDTPESDDGTDTPEPADGTDTPEPDDTATPEPDDGTDTPEPDDTATPEPDDGTDTPDPDDGAGGDGPDPGTPEGDGPGFGVFVTLAALLFVGYRWRSKDD